MNNQVLTAAEHLNTISWPNLQKINVPPIKKGDCMLVCAGFEDRTIEALHQTSEAGVTGFSLGVIKYLPFYPQNKLEEINTIAQNINLIVKEFEYNREEPAGIGEKIKDFACEFNRIFIDISGMSRLLIVQILVALLELENCSVTILYGEADGYPPSKEQFERDQNNDNDDSPLSYLSYLSSGIFEVATTPELASVSMFGEAIRLVVFPSFDPAQLTNLVQELQPTYINLIHGIPPAEKNKWRTEAIRRLNEPTMGPLREENTTHHEVGTREYKETLLALLEIYKKRSMFDRIVVAPTGSKMQAVAVGLFRAVLYDIQIVYPTPKIFTQPDEYTSGMRQLYIVNLPVDKIREFNQ
ncbi:MAG: hypothetical protein OXU54_04745 [Gammaproteobacteria bacterium]|nr:hypothetical protein [Gammaproteobacteria bacterium]